MTQRDGMGREAGGGFRMGNTCTPVADSCWCMAKPIQYCKVKIIIKEKTPSKTEKRFHSSFQRKITIMEVESTVGKKRYFKRGVLLCKGSRFWKVTVEVTITQPSSPPWWETNLLFQDLGKDFELILFTLPRHWENHGHPCYQWGAHDASLDSGPCVITWPPETEIWRRPSPCNLTCR